MLGKGWEEVASGIDSWFDSVLDAPQPRAPMP
jgi:hypothetical protein